MISSTQSCLNYIKYGTIFFEQPTIAMVMKNTNHARE